MFAHEIVIVGAGQAGLSAAYEARRAGLSPVVLEAAETAAGSWPRYYDSLTLFSPAAYSSLPGLPFPGDPDRYPSRDEVAEYLTTYADWLEVDVRLGTRVHEIAARPDRLTVSAEHGGTLDAAMVIAATGSFGAPYRPPLPGIEDFTGTVLHAAEYAGPGPFEGARVVVVGAGNSAIQIAAELARVAQTTLATRAPIRWAQQRPLGRDLHWWLKRTRLDTAPLTPLLHRLPVTVLDDGAYRTAIEAGRPDRRPVFERLDQHEVVWADGARERVDALILATGYRHRFPYLAGTAALDSTGSPLHRGGVSTTVRGLGYVGLEFQRSFSSNTLRGAARDARHVIGSLRRQGAHAPRRRLAIAG